MTPSMHTPHPSAARSTPSAARSLRHAGFTLVELLVSVALGLLVMVALIAVYLNVSRTNTEMAKTNSLIENGRFAVDILGEDLAHAGFWGGYVPQFDNFALRTTPADAPKPASLAQGPCLPYASWDADYRDMLIGIPVEAYAGVPTGCSGVVVDRKAGTDVLVVRHAETCSYTFDGTNWVPSSPNCEAFNGSKVYFQASFCAAETEAATPLRYVLYNDPSNDPNLFQLKRRGCTGDPASGPTLGTRAALRKFVSNIYYVRTWASDAGDGVPTLVRATFGISGGVPVHEPAAALIEGIENLAVELGIDSQSRCGTAANYSAAISSGATGNLVEPTACAYVPATPASNTLPTVRGDGVPELFKRCGAGCTVAELTDAVAVKLFVLARARDASAGHVDGKTYTLGSNAPTVVTPSGSETAIKRHVFQTSVRLSNPSGRRETP
jgi:type IV pilus assembly protein PilW